MVDEVGLRGLEDGLDRVADEIVGGDVGVDLEREVRDDLEELPLDAQDRADDAVVGRAEVHVDETVGEETIERDPEAAEAAVQVLVGDAVRVRGEDLVEVPQVDGVPGDRRDVRVEDEEEGQRVVEVLRRIELEVDGSLA
jgi:hypothetical protein